MKILQVSANGKSLVEKQQKQPKQIQPLNIVRVKENFKFTFNKHLFNTLGLDTKGLQVNKMLNDDLVLTNYIFNVVSQENKHILFKKSKREDGKKPLTYTLSDSGTAFPIGSYEAVFLNSINDYTDEETFNSFFQNSEENKVFVLNLIAETNTEVVQSTDDVVLPVDIEEVPLELLD